MDFDFENLGPLSSVHLELNNLTIICGKNNTGKTYINYAIYGFYNTLYELLAKTIHQMDFITSKEHSSSINMEAVFKQLPEINFKVFNAYSADISTLVFNSNKKDFLNFKMFYKTTLSSCTLDSFISFYKELLENYLTNSMCPLFVKEENHTLSLFEESLNNSNILISSILEKSLISTIYSFVYNINFTTFILPAERSGLNLLFKELNQNRNNLIYNLNDLSLLNLKNQISQYPLPIKNYLNFLNEDLPKTSTSQRINNYFRDISLSLEENVVGGSYIITDDNNIKFSIKNSHSKSKFIDFHLASSTARTLFGLDLYLKYKLKEGDLLVIDEPELNLHPDNQRKIARVIARLVNKGVKVLISTHSDYLIKEFNNLIMLSRPFKHNYDLRKKYNYLADEILNENLVNAYISYDETIQKAEIDTEGIIINTFDEVINSYNKSSDEIYYSYLEDTEL